ncbi:hypothetical protein AAZX31_12G198300 [Glycine max]|nr:uncharacterized protein LOC100798869 isoform X1 [Glycine max]XP_014620550.1 uncharacterized protein LOC100798869 isoform X1 [Glycine max]KHN27932.1 hypothetical protein glysoja_007664 [Glycine soja]KAG4986926.1 hypothetical protein JHK86_034617 [Glycine max]KAG5120126.1 hypothetical protein JHK82_034546 [Glycine max]KAG5141111.1 hypothetical protein JHK84_034879 [Glycine max]|eukprot:XP_014620549.1 uncharacterized protein LOC100798869 isoform X1 [Glycine max]
MAMDAKGITWVGNIFQKFEDIYVDVEDTMLEETVKYIGNQMQTVGESVKKIYSDVMQDLLPPPLYDLDETSASELPIDQYIDAGFSNKSFQGSKKITVKDDTNQTTEDSRIKHDVDNDVIHAKSGDSDALFTSASCNSVKGNSFISHARQYVGSTDIRSNLGGDENRQNKSIPASKTVSEITLSKADTCSTSQSCELSRVNQNHAATVSKAAFAEVTTITSVDDCCNEIENASTEEIPNVLVLAAESAEEKEMHVSSYSSSDLFGDPYGVTMVGTFEPDNYSYPTTIASHPEITETWDLDVPKIGTIIVEQGHKTIQQDDELKLEETCVMVTRDELESVAIALGNLITSKNKKRQPFSLSKKAARRQEYEKLAILHGNNEIEKGDFAENLCPTLQDDHKKLLLPDISEPEWELL